MEGSENKLKKVYVKFSKKEVEKMRKKLYMFENL